MAKKTGEIVLFANYYDGDCKGFYFKTADELKEKAEKLHAKNGCEEYSVEFIDGPSGPAKLFNALFGDYGPNHAQLELFLDRVVELNEHDQAALFWYVGQQGRSGFDIEDALEKIDDEIRLFQGTVKDYAYELVDDIGIESISNNEAYFDFEAFGRDAKMDLDADSEDDAHYFDMSDEEYGEELVDSMGGVKELDKKTVSTYFDYDAFARDLELGGDVDTVDFAGSEWVVTNPHV